jgi:hypothetical protein
VTVQEQPLCHCGLPLHYVNPASRLAVEKLVESFGEFQKIAVPGLGTWMVQRHYIALHGLHAQDLPTLGFEKVD